MLPTTSPAAYSPGIGCSLTLDRKGAQEQRVSMFVPLTPDEGYRLLQYLCENVVQPELWEDVIAEHLPVQAALRGGSKRGR